MLTNQVIAAVVYVYQVVGYQKHYGCVYELSNCHVFWVVEIKLGQRFVVLVHDEVFESFHDQTVYHYYCYRRKYLNKLNFFFISTFFYLFILSKFILFKNIFTDNFKKFIPVSKSPQKTISMKIKNFIPNLDFSISF